MVVGAASAAQVRENVARLEADVPDALWADLADAGTGAPMRVGLLVTCLNDVFFPETGRNVVRLLRRLGVDVDFPQAQTCCGQPMVNTGYLDEAVPVVRNFVARLRGVRRRGGAVRLLRRLGPAPARDRRAARAATPGWSTPSPSRAPRRTSSPSSWSTCSA